MPNPFFADLVRELAQEGGTGPLTPTGAVPGHRRFADAVPPGVSFHYAVAGIARPEQWEVGTGRIGGDGRLFRDLVAASSSGGVAVDFAAGLKTIALTVGAGWFAASDVQAATLASDIATLGDELTEQAAAIEVKQPLSTTHGSAGTGEATDMVTVRRGAGWVNIPLTALAFRGADDRYALNGSLGVENGAAPAPSVTFANDPDTGLFRPAANVLALATGGVERARITAAGAVGIGTTAPAGHVDIEHGGSTAPSLVLSNTSWDRRLQFRASAAGYIINCEGWTDGSSRELRLATGGTDRAVIDASGNVSPGSDNAQTLGRPSARWSVIYAGSGTINTSDAREKAWRGAPSPAEIAAARRIIGELGFFQWNDAIAAKGEGRARLHFGIRAQAVWAIMADEGLVAPLADGSVPSSRYAFLCYDEWGEGTAGEDRSAGDRFGLRTDQLALFLIAAQDARIATLEAAA